MKVPSNFKLVGISMLIIVGLTACGKHRTTEAAKTPPPAEHEAAKTPPPAEHTATPDEFLQHLVSTNATVLGTPIGETSPIIQISFSNGHATLSQPGRVPNPAFSGPVLRVITKNLTCVFFEFPLGNVGDEHRTTLCVTTKDMAPFKKDDLVIQTHFTGKPDLIFRAQIMTASSENTMPTQSQAQQTPRDMALASGLKLTQYVIDFAKSTNPTCRAGSDGLFQISKSVESTIRRAEDLRQQGDSAADSLYESAQGIANAGLGNAESMSNCP